jgi:aminoglycoside phosphotransferase (APT) family kinase protein
VTRMFPDELDIDAGLVRRLVEEQFPEWADLALERVEPAGTDNAIFRLGPTLAVRLPRRERTNSTLVKERHWLANLAPRLPLEIPVPVANGQPTPEYPLDWYVYGWLPGAPATERPIADMRQAAVDLAGFVKELERLDATAGPRPGAHNFFRGEPVANRDVATREAIAKLRRALDAKAVLAAWESALDAPEWSGDPVWIHGDLDARNLLVDDGRLSGVIDWGCLGVGDPACDVMVAWKMLSGESRDVFRAELAVDEATWERARGWALSQAVAALAYYTLETNAVLVLEAQRWLVAVLEDRA